MLAHEKPMAYQRSIRFVGWSGELLDDCPTRLAARDQLDRASTSIPLNIAEGNGKFSAKDRARFLQMALGSALESAACLDVLVARKAVTPERVTAGKAQIEEIVRLLYGLLDRFECRLGEEPVGYGEEDEDEDGKGER
jgi:four helix bundle protein